MALNDGILTIVGDGMKIEVEGTATDSTVRRRQREFLVAVLGGFRVRFRELKRLALIQ
jgi:hypothetical protein